MDQSLPVTPIERIVIKNYQRWGQLVKTWTTGVNHIGDGHDYPIPTTVDEFKTQLSNAGCEATVPDSYQTLQVVQGDLEHLVIRLPPKVMIEAAEQELTQDPGGYPLPWFYGELAFGGAVPQIADKLSFHDMRIGDYTISNCR